MYAIPFWFVVLCTSLGSANEFLLYAKKNIKEKMDEKETKRMQRKTKTKMKNIYNETKNGCALCAHNELVRQEQDRLRRTDAAMKCTRIHNFHDLWPGQNAMRAHSVGVKLQMNSIAFPFRVSVLLHRFVRAMKDKSTENKLKIPNGRRSS